jgi:predicted metal-dependent peptidase
MDKFKTAIANLLMTKAGRWYSKMVVDLKAVSTTSIDTAATDGESILYNPKFIEGLENKQVTFLLVHEIMHVALGHNSRMHVAPDAPHEVHNIAMDLAINSHPLMDTVDVEKIENGVYPKDFNLPEGKSYEWYLKKILDDPSLQDELPRCSRGDTGDVIPNGRLGVDEQEAIATSAIMGDDRGDVAEAVGLVKVKHLDWKKVLKQFVTNTMGGGDSITFNQINRFHSDEFILPSSYDEVVKDLVILLDTSGSCYHAFAAEGLAHIDRMRRQLKFNCHVIQHDTKVTKTTRLNSGQDIDPQITGGGGTCHVDAFREAVKKHRAHAIISFTDMISRFPVSCRTPTLFVVPQDYDKTYAPSWGKVIETVR